MQGSIRLIVGFILVLGGVGGIENSTAQFPWESALIALGGLALMAWAIPALNRGQA